MKYSLAVALAIGMLCVGVVAAAAAKQSAIDADAQPSLLQADRAAFGSGTGRAALNEKLLDPNFTWTDSSGKTQNKSEIVQALSLGKGLPIDAGNGSVSETIEAHVHGEIGLIQENVGKVYALGIWVKRRDAWRLLIYQAVSIGASASSEPGSANCENPCKTVPFQPRNADEREVIGAYQAVERAVTAHDSAAWASHIADEFFAVTSNSDRPLDKATRMAGLDNRKVAGIAPFPLVSARMFAFGETMVMISRQQPEKGLPLHVTRVWFKRNGAWLEAYSYQTTIRVADISQ
jgi:hypothetical protein